MNSSKTTDVPDQSTPRLTCDFISRTDGEAGQEQDGSVRKAFLFQETGKKSSYVLQQHQQHQHEDSAGEETKDSNDTAAQRGIVDYYSIPKPSHIVIENASINSTFFFGGFQIICSAKNVEIYLTNHEGKETYLMTCKAIPYKKDDVAAAVSTQKWYRAMCVVPGGPRSISKLRLKIVGSNSEHDMILYMKLTARLAENTSPRKSEKVDQKASDHLKFAPPTTNTTALTQSDLGSAMAGLSFMAREQEKNMTELVKEQSIRTEKFMESYFLRMELNLRNIKSTITAQHQSIKENQIIINEQKQIMEDQGSQINKLLNNDENLQVRVLSLQAEISTLRYQMPSNNNMDISGANIGDDDDDDDDRNNLGPIMIGIEQQNSALSVDDTKNSTSSTKAATENIDCITGGRNNSDESCKVVVSDQERDTKMEFIHLRNAIQSTAKEIVAEPIATCFSMMGNAEEEREVRVDFKNAEEAERQMKIRNIHFKDAIKKTARELKEEKPFGGCGPMLVGAEEDIMRNIDAMVSSHANKKDSSEIVNKYDEDCSYTANIEVALVEEELLSPDQPPNFDPSQHKEL
jgi:hypothetical protein